MTTNFSSGSAQSLKQTKSSSPRNTIIPIHHHHSPPELSTTITLHQNYPPPSLSTRTIHPSPSLSTRTIHHHHSPRELSTTITLHQNYPPPSLSTRTIHHHHSPPELSTTITLHQNYPPPSLSTRTIHHHHSPRELSTTITLHQNYPPPSLSTRTIHHHHSPPELSTTITVHHHHDSPPSLTATLYLTDRHVTPLHRPPEELGATFFPGPPEAWAAAPTLTPFPELGPSPAPGAPSQLTHPALIPHPHHPATHPGALAQVPLRMDAQYWDLLQKVQPATIIGPPPGQVASSMPAVGQPPTLVSAPMLASPIPNGIQSSGHGLFTQIPGGLPASSLSLSSSPCSTLFVANLGQFSSEQELKDIFSSFQGFVRLRMHNKGGSPVAFVEFQDVRQAQEAMTRLQGFVLLSSDRGGIRIEYAKNKMGEVYFLPPQYPGGKEIPIVQSPVSMATVF
ncbi:hypothetical protein RRG08_051919 [Elysia crispata]|uniref:RRM domain-containing protein n=1 Tax=Elysia crispata TaxID=231223 RepID=A0AAE0Y1U8_9GAST|nr:hypothetical protein RRG08_051919 [Elysia crispata]